ncbi:MAG: hypothetical protein IKQ46_13575 [Bacteroidales bacterium]|jgi:hypothetical protein|nr:hypothetical protein [Bacteroidales bacterium]
MKKNFCLIFALLLTLVFNSCEDDLTDWDSGDEAFVYVTVGDVYKEVGGRLYYDYIDGYRVYCFTRYDAEHYGVYNTDNALDCVVTDRDGVAAFRFTRRDARNSIDYVFVVFDYNDLPTQCGVTIHPNGEINLVMFADGTAPLEPIYRRLNPEYNLVTVSDKAEYVLEANGGRNYAKVSLPENTVYWFYSFTSYEYGDYTNTFSLLNNLQEYYSPQSGVSQDAASRIIPPAGAESSMNIYLLDADNALDFSNGRDFHFINSLKMASSSVIEENEYTDGTFYLGLESLSSAELRVVLEVVAVVAE